jgi:phospholipid-binding lipoprotein MlaA
MSVAALTTAMAVATATMPSGNVAAPVVEFSSQPIAAEDGSQEAGATGGAEVPPTLVLAQSATSPQPSDPGQSKGPAASAQPETQPTPPAGGQTEIIVTGRKANPADPLEELNSKSYKVAQSVDESVVAPIAFTYEKIMPRPVRKGLDNFLHNLGEPVVFLNYLLQLKPGKAAETLGRFAINSTLGMAGVVDIAKRKPFNLPHRENGFANTLGYYGVKPGPYFFLPLVGPTTLRDFIGGRLDLLLLPTAFPKVFSKTEIVVPIWVLKELGRRVEFEDELGEIRATQDPYVAARTHYLQKRQAEIDALHGRRTPETGPSEPTRLPSTSAKEPPQRQFLPTLSFTGDLLGELSIFGASTSVLRIDFEGSPIASSRGEQQWSAPSGVVLTF